jgi:hypothetical protein
MQNEESFMFKKIRETLKTSLTRNSIDSSHFNDPIASQTSWIPVIHSNGSSFCTHELSKVGAERVIFKTSRGIFLILLLLLFIGIGALCVSASFFFSKEATDTTLESSLPYVIPMLIGIMFTFASVVGYQSFTKPIVFDKQLGYFWKGKKTPEDVSNVDSIKIHACIKDIYAVQLIAKYLSSEGDKTSYSYELNLIIADSERINVLDHGKLDKIREDAQKLSNFLEKPLWDAV